MTAREITPQQCRWLMEQLGLLKKGGDICRLAPAINEVNRR